MNISGSIAAIAGLYLGREVLVPIALAALLSFVLAPPVRLLLRWYIPRSIAVIVVALIAFAAIFGRWASVSTRGAWRCNRAFHFLGTKVGTILLLIYSVGQSTTASVRGKSR